MLPKISIITPSFNQGHFIEQTICSVLDQDYPNVEYIIMDGGSIDNTVEVIKKYEKHISYWISEKDNGQSDAINKGFKRATGEIINWLNSDDYYEPNTLTTIAENFQNPDVNVLCARSRLFGKGIKDHFSSGTDIYPNNPEKTIGRARIDQPETWFRKSIIDKMGLLNADLHYVMDKEWWMRYLLLFGLEGVKKIPNVLVNFRLHPESKTKTSQSKFNLETHALYYTIADFLKNPSAKKFIEQEGEVFIVDSLYDSMGKSQYDLQKVLQHYLFFCGASVYAQNDYKRAMKYFEQLKLDLLDLTDRQAIRKLKFRMLLMPVAFKMFLNNFIQK